jgi:type VI secretion system secreted protein VgrG
MAVDFTQDNLALTVSTPLGQDALLLTRVRGEERLSGLFCFTLEMTSEDSNLDFDSIVGQNATVTLELATGTKRYFNGIVGRFVQAGRDVRCTTYYAELYPWLWLLTMTRDCRIFQNQSVPDIIESIFSELGFTDYKNALSATYTARDYCVQYQESAYDFVSRLMEDEGIFYFFEHEEGKHTLVLADDADAHANCPGQATVRWASWFPSRPNEDIITHCTLAQQVIPNAYALDDFNFETPSTDLLVTAQSAEGQRRLYDYPGGFTKRETGEQMANKRLEARELPQKLLRGNGFCSTFAAGYTFTLSGHNRDDVNGAYVLRWVSHTATPERYANSFEAFPTSVPFRPPPGDHQTGDRRFSNRPRGGQKRRGHLDRQVRPRQGAVSLGPEGQKRREQLLLGAGSTGVGGKRMGHAICPPDRYGGGREFSRRRSRPAHHHRHGV